jgi:hypothetical protein
VPRPWPIAEVSRSTSSPIAMVMPTGAAPARTAVTAVRVVTAGASEKEYPTRAGITHRWAFASFLLADCRMVTLLCAAKQRD